MEKLFYDINEKERNNKVVISERENLKIKLKHFALRNSNDNSTNNLTPEEYRSLRSLKNNPNIVIQRPDKGGGTVVLDRSNYESKLEELISDHSKFRPCPAKQSETVKSKINIIASKYKTSAPQMCKKLQVKGEFPPGHLYGLPKVHKSITDPPLRPIISMSGTVTHSLAQYLNDIIRPHINKQYMLKSTDEFLVALQDTTVSPDQEIVSLDVTSLFTNVPVDATIDIIINAAFNNVSIPPPPIPQDDLRELLKICTQETPFLFKNQHYIQCDGVSMGSPLGPTFADFYMSHLENLLLSQDRISNPVKTSGL